MVFWVYIVVVFVFCDCSVYFFYYVLSSLILYTHNRTYHVQLQLLTVPMQPTLSIILKSAYTISCCYSPSYKLLQRLSYSCTQQLYQISSQYLEEDQLHCYRLGMKYSRRGNSTSQRVELNVGHSFCYKTPFALPGFYQSLNYLPDDPF